MKKYTVILLLIASSVCFAQNSFQGKISFDKVELRIGGNLKIFNNPMYSFMIFRSNKIEAYKQIFISLGKRSVMRPAFGFEYRYSSGKISPNVRFDFIGNYKKYFLKLTYGSNLETHGVSTRLEYKLSETIWAGVQTLNELIGPRFDCQFYMFGDKKFRIGTYYLSKDRYGFSLRFDIFDFFPKLKLKRNNTEKWLNEKLNPFY